MQKEELRKLKRINATPKMVRMAQNNKENMIYRRRTDGMLDDWEDRGVRRYTRYDMFVRCQTRGPYLMVCIFFPQDIAEGEMTPAYEIYCNPEGDEYITRRLRNGKETGWSVAMADNLKRVPLFMYERCWYEGFDGRIWQNREGMDSIKAFLHTNDKGIWGLVEWQRRAKCRKTEEAEKRQQAPWDADMALVPEIFPSFLHWMKKEVVREYFIYYWYDRNGTDEGYCTHCERMVPVMKPRHNMPGTCSRCHHTVMYKAEGKAAKKIYTGYYEGQVIQRIRGGIVIRTFKQRLVYRKETYKEPEPVTSEIARTLVKNDGSVRKYTIQNYKNKCYRFMPKNDYLSADSPTYGGTGIKLYTGNLAALKKTALRTSTLDLWAAPLPVPTERYLALEKKYPVTEMLVRIGMFRLAKDLMCDINRLNAMNNRETGLARILKIDGARLKRLRAADGGFQDLEWYQYEKLADTIWPDDVISDLADSGLHTASFNFLPHSVRAGLSIVTIRNYLKKQSAMAGRTMSAMNGTWADYINMAEKAKMDVCNERIWKPKNLTVAHDELVMILQHGDMEKEAGKLEKKWKKVGGQLPKLQKYEYTDGRFSIVAPRTVLDIVKEGRILQHCVHTCDFYFDRIERDESYLFFLRKAGQETVPWYTLEVEPNGNIRQKRTTGDRQLDDLKDAVEFLKKWQAVFVKRMTAEEKKLGKKAERARIEGYAKLRRDGNKVWHGPLAGKLLADVLENDFMAAGQ